METANKISDPQEKLSNEETSCSCVKFMTPSDQSVYEEEDCPDGLQVVLTTDELPRRGFSDLDLGLGIKSDTPNISLADCEFDFHRADL